MALGKRKLTDRKKRAIATAQKINRTALRLFFKNGFDGVTVDEICEKAGVSKGAFYVYYKSKEQVIVEVFSKTDETYEAYVANELASISNPVDKLWLLGKKALSYSGEMGVEIMQVTYRARLTFNKKGTTYRSENRSIYKLVESLVREAQARGFMRSDLSSEEIAQMILRCVSGITHDWCLVNGGFDLVSEGEKVFDVLLKGLRPESLKKPIEDPPFSI
jgi:AcrR family transcriptional regulator